MLSDKDLQRYMTDPVEWAENCYYILDRDGLPATIKLEPHQKKILREIFSMDSTGRLKYSQALFATIKKSGKSEILSLACLFVAQYIAPPFGECYLMASDEQQAAQRSYANIIRAIRLAPELYPGVKVSGKEIVFANGTTIRAMATHISASGLQPSFIGFDELWSYRSPSFENFWDEAARVSPTLKNSLIMVATYAGITSESKILERLWTLGEKGDPILDDLPCYHNKEARLFAYIDSGEEARRMPWQQGDDGEVYYRAERETLRDSAFRRQHLNEWTSGESAFFRPGAFEACIDGKLERLKPNKRIPIVVGVDAATRHDRAAIVGVYREWRSTKLSIAFNYWWQPRKGETLNLKVLEDKLIELSKGYFIWKVVADPFQMRYIISNLQGVSIEPFPQTLGNLRAAGNNLWRLVDDGNLKIYEDEALLEEAYNAVGIEDDQGVRLTKSRPGAFIDQIAALSFACLHALKIPARNPFSANPGLCADTDWNRWGRCPLLAGNPAMEQFVCTDKCKAYQQVARHMNRYYTQIYAESGLPDHIKKLSTFGRVHAFSQMVAPFEGARPFGWKRGKNI